MTTKLSELLTVFESLWPESGADEWDQVGLATGSTEQEISKVLLCVDPTLAVFQEAESKSCQLVISHHPLLLDGVHSVSEGELKGDILSFAIKNSIALFSAHTNADIVHGGVSDVLASAIGLENAVPLVPVKDNAGHGRIGNLKASLTLRELAGNINSLLPATNAPIRVAGDPAREIRKVAVVGGSGASYISSAVDSGADCLVTSDLKHHVSLDVISHPTNRICLIDISHFAAESLWLEPSARALAKLTPTVEFVVSEINTDPWSLSIPGKLQ